MKIGSVSYRSRHLVLLLAFTMTFLGLGLAGAKNWPSETLVLLLTINLATTILAVWTVSAALQARHRSDIWQNYRQLETLVGLYHTLEPGYLLPPTRDWAASPDFLRVLLDAIEEDRPTVIVEAGCGASTVVCALAARKTGNVRIVSLEHDRSYADACKRTLAKHQLDGVAQVVHAPLCKHTIDGEDYTWYEMDALADVEHIDLLVVDGPPPGTSRLPRWPAIPLLHQKLRKNSLVILDDADREPERQTVAAWIDRFPTLTHTFMECEKGASVLRVNN